MFQWFKKLELEPSLALFSECHDLYVKMRECLGMLLVFAKQCSGDKEVLLLQRNGDHEVGAINQASLGSVLADIFHSKYPTNISASTGPLCRWKGTFLFFNFVMFENSYDALNWPFEDRLSKKNNKKEPNFFTTFTSCLWQAKRNARIGVVLSREMEFMSLPFSGCLSHLFNCGAGKCQQLLFSLAFPTSAACDVQWRGTRNWNLKTYSNKNAHFCKHPWPIQKEKSKHFAQRQIGTCGSETF